MDQIKIGKFIADMRKKQNLTQRQLAERLNVTDKTVSKWETGYRVPDASILQELSLALKIDINELLAGEKFLSEDFSAEDSERVQQYVKKTEDNIVGLVGELNAISERSRSGRLGVMAGILLIALALLYLFGFSLRMGRIVDLFDWPTLFYLSGIKFAILSISGWFHDYLNAWRACFSRRELRAEEKEPAIQAVKYADALTLALGCLISLLSLFSLLNYGSGSDLIYPAFAQVVLTLLYTAAQKTAYVILLFRMKRMSERKGEKDGGFVGGQKSDQEIL